MSFRRAKETIYKRYLLFMLGLFSFCALPLVALLFTSYIFLLKTGEFTELSDVVKRQIKTNAIYGTGLHFNEYPHKLEIIKSVKPDLVVIGSSRTLQFREEFFNASFVCACLTVRDIEDIEDFVSDLTQQPHPPKVVVLGLDYWWFLDDYENSSQEKFRFASTLMPSVHSLIKPVIWLLEGKISTEQVSYTIKGEESRQTGRLNFHKIGVNAIFKDLGIRKDGSMIDGYKVSGSHTKQENKKLFWGYIDVIERGASPFQRGDINMERVERLKAAIRVLQSEGVKVTTVLLPFPPTISEALLSSEKYKVISALRTVLQNIGDDHHDFLDGRQIPSDDCEYLDGRHAGDVTTMRMLMMIKENRPESHLSTYVKADLYDWISKFEGQIIAKFKPELYNFSETDYLELGCERKKTYPHDGSKSG